MHAAIIIHNVVIYQRKDFSNMDTSTLIISRIQTFSSIGAVILFIIGIFYALRYINISRPDAPEEELATFNKSMRTSTILIAIGLVLYWVSSFCVNLAPMGEEDCGIITIIVRSFFDMFKNVGYLVFLPLLLKLWRKNIQRKPVK